MDRRRFLAAGATAAAVGATSAAAGAHSQQDPKKAPKAAPITETPIAETPKAKSPAGKQDPAAKAPGEPKAGAQSPTPSTAEAAKKTPDAKPFQLRYAPHFGMFSNHAKSLDDQLQFAADEGFEAWEDNGMARRDEATQRRLADKMQQCGIQMGVFVAHADFSKPTFASGKKDFRDRVLADIDKACTVAGRVNAQWCTVVPGTVDPRKDEGYQFSNTVDLLKRCCDKIEKNKSELVMVLEPLNFRDHPRLLLTKVAQAFAICRAVGSEHCKILDDLYHQQITEGNLIPNIDDAWSEIAYFQVGDNPGRNEPDTGEIHFRNVFRHIHGKKFAGIVGMEHGKSQGGKEGERKLIAAYRNADSF
ncbi:MAG: TIM barrel protein [Planctomycetota bacterium]